MAVMKELVRAMPKVKMKPLNSMIPVPWVENWPSGPAKSRAARETMRKISSIQMTRATEMLERMVDREREERIFFIVCFPVVNFLYSIIAKKKL
jgi:hypothetical protein